MYHCLVRRRSCRHAATVPEDPDERSMPKSSRQRYTPKNIDTRMTTIVVA